jgi:protein tyrosine/serine phosphatase
MTHALRWLAIATIVLIVVVSPIVSYRLAYTHGKRLRVVEDGKLYRSGQLTAAGFRDAVARYGIRTVLNVQDEYPNPDLQISFWNRDTVKESELCKQLGVRYVTIPPDLVSRGSVPEDRPRAVDQFLALMDDPDVYPVLLHCKAGLHRTGCLSAVYRMEYQGWSNAAAYRELKAHGFGDTACTSANDYVKQYVLTFRRGLRVPPGIAQGRD